MKALKQKERLNRFCHKCDEKYTPTGNCCKLCDNCLKKSKENAIKRRKKNGKSIRTKP